MQTKLMCYSPVDGSLVASRPTVTFNQALEQVLKARDTQKEWADRSLEDRRDLVLIAVRELENKNEEITIELAKMMGRPICYCGEYKGVIERSTYMSSIAKSALANIEVGEDQTFKRYIKRVPHGVVFVVAPWNYPYMTAINTIVPALIAGNVVIMKHAQQTLLVGERIVDAFEKAGIPEEVVSNIFLDHSTTKKLIESRVFDYVNFTGSVEGGREIERAASGTFVGVGTELGGKDPAYVMENANLDASVEALMDGAMFNSGQCCCGIERIYVHESLYDEFIQKSVAWVRKLKLGNPLLPETTLGPMANARFAKVVRLQIEDAVSKGAHALIPIMENDDGECYLTPQILINVNHDMDIMLEESFGPVVGIMPVSSDDEAIHLMNDSKYGLTASLWTTDLERAERVGNLLETGTVLLNRADYLDPALCWTGCKQTGNGGSLSEIGYHNLTRPKSFYMKKTT